MKRYPRWDAPSLNHALFLWIGTNLLGGYSSKTLGDNKPFCNQKVGSFLLYRNMGVEQRLGFEGDPHQYFGKSSFPLCVCNLGVPQQFRGYAQQSLGESRMILEVGEELKERVVEEIARQYEQTFTLGQRRMYDSLFCSRSPFISLWRIDENNRSLPCVKIETHVNRIFFGANGGLSERLFEYIANSFLLPSQRAVVSCAR